MLYSAGAAAVGATVYAGIKGKAILGDTFEKSVKGYAKAVGKGYAHFGQLANEKAIQPALKFIKSIPSKISNLFHKAEESAVKVEEAVQQ